jgi:hypothetical protein
MNGKSALSKLVFNFKPQITGDDDFKEISIQKYIKFERSSLKIFFQDDFPKYELNNIPKTVSIMVKAAFEELIKVCSEKFFFIISQIYFISISEKSN